jgi:hypothetical protein
MPRFSGAQAKKLGRVVLLDLSAEPNMSLECQKMMHLLATMDSSIGKRKVR